MIILNVISMIFFTILIVKGFRYEVVPINLFLLVFLVELIKLVITFEVSNLLVLGTLILYYIGMTTYNKGINVVSLVGMTLILFLNLLI